MSFPHTLTTDAQFRNAFERNRDECYTKALTTEDKFLRELWERQTIFWERMTRFIQGED